MNLETEYPHQTSSIPTFELNSILDTLYWVHENIN